MCYKFVSRFEPVIVYSTNSSYIISCNMSIAIINVILKISADIDIFTCISLCVSCNWMFILWKINKYNIWNICNIYLGCVKCIWWNIFCFVSDKTCNNVIGICYLWYHYSSGLSCYLYPYSCVHHKIGSISGGNSDTLRMTGTRVSELTLLCVA